MSATFVPLPVAQSSAEAEYNACTFALTESIYTKQVWHFLHDKHLDSPLTLAMFTNSESVIAMIDCNHVTKNSRHIDRHIHFVKQAQMQGMFHSVFKFLGKSILLMLVQRIYLVLTSRNIFPWFMSMYLSKWAHQVWELKGECWFWFWTQWVPFRFVTCWTQCYMLGDLSDGRSGKFWHPLKPEPSETCNMTLWNPRRRFGWSGWFVSLI